MWVSDITLGLALGLLVLMLFSYFSERGEGDGPIRVDILAVTGLLMVASYLCHLKGW